MLSVAIISRCIFKYLFFYCVFVILLCRKHFFYFSLILQTGPQWNPDSGCDPPTGWWKDSDCSICIYDGPIISLPTMEARTKPTGSHIAEVHRRRPGDMEDRRLGHRDLSHNLWFRPALWWAKINVFLLQRFPKFTSIFPHSCDGNTAISDSLYCSIWLVSLISCLTAPPPD